MEIKGQLCGVDSLLYVDSGNRTPVAVLALQGLDLLNHPMLSHINFCLCSPDTLQMHVSLRFSLDFGGCQREHLFSENLLFL